MILTLDKKNDKIKLKVGQKWEKAAEIQPLSNQIRVVRMDIENIGLIWMMPVSTFEHEWEQNKPQSDISFIPKPLIE